MSGQQRPGEQAPQAFLAEAPRMHTIDECRPETASEFAGETAA